jgi:ABC-type nitrate/sulfonate/bicarbonate transport system substrate-binding protein
MSSKKNSASAKLRSLRIGYVSLLDAAPLLAARAMGFYAAEGLEVTLSREVGWATIRDKVLTGELDAAHAPAHMLWAARLGIGAPAFPACTGLILNLHGNAICLSNRLRVWGVHDAGSLRTEALRRRGERKLVFGVVYPFSSHNLHLRAWLRSAGLVPDRDVRIAIVPPAQMLPTLAAGAIDGFMAGEPWTSLAIAQGHGWCPAWSGALFPGHVEKALMVREDFAATAEHAALLRALISSGAWCDEPHKRAELATLLSAQDCLRVPAEILRPALCGPFNFGQGHAEHIPDFHIFHAGGAQVPTRERALSVQRDLAAAGLISQQLPAELPGRLFREDLHSAACAQAAPTLLSGAH